VESKPPILPTRCLSEFYTDANLNNRIDGGNEAYISRGMRLAMYQDMTGPDPNICTVVAMDFGTDASAKAMFDYEKGLTEPRRRYRPTTSRLPLAKRCPPVSRSTRTSRPRTSSCFSTATVRIPARQCRWRPSSCKR